MCVALALAAVWPEGLCPDRSPTGCCKAVTAEAAAHILPKDSAPTAPLPSLGPEASKSANREGIPPPPVAASASSEADVY